MTDDAFRSQRDGSSRHHEGDNRVTHNVEHVFGLQVPPDTAVMLNPREHLAYQWLPWQTAAERCFSPSNAEAIRQLPRSSL